LKPVIKGPVDEGLKYKLPEGAQVANN